MVESSQDLLLCKTKKVVISGQIDSGIKHGICLPLAESIYIIKIRNEIAAQNKNIQEIVVTHTYHKKTPPTKKYSENNYSHRSREICLSSTCKKTADQFPFKLPKLLRYLKLSLKGTKNFPYIKVHKKPGSGGSRL